MTSACYYKKKIFFKKGFLDDCIDATYILHLEGNGRIENIYKQLEIYHPSKTVILFFNKGYEKCEKKLFKETPPYDLVETYFNVFKDAKENNYHNILILEDDFIFNEKILELKNTSEISKFIHDKNRKKEKFMYVLGCLPILQIPTMNYHHRKMVLKGGTHACIYSPELRNQILKTDQNKIYDWDIYSNLYFKTYMFYQPLCYQLFQETENKKHWIYMFIISDFFYFLLDYFQLDQKAEPGFSFFYWFSFIMFLVLFILFIIIFIFILQMFASKKIKIKR